LGCKNYRQIKILGAKKKLPPNPSKSFNREGASAFAGKTRLRARNRKRRGFGRVIRGLTVRSRRFGYGCVYFRGYNHAWAVKITAELKSWGRRKSFPKPIKKL
jgi:hypothetical protein